MPSLPTPWLTTRIGYPILRPYGNAILFGQTSLQFSRRHRVNPARLGALAARLQRSHVYRVERRLALQKHAAGRRRGTIPEDTLKQITTGSSLAATGTLVESPAKGQAVELKVASIHLYGGADPQTYPLQKKGHTLEFLREISHLRVRSNTFGAAFRAAQRSNPRDPSVFPGARVYLRAHADRHDFGLRRRRPDVRRVDVEHARAAAHGRR